MGCVGSKKVVEAADVYHPPPASIAYFDIDAIKEPWLITKDNSENGKSTHVALTVLEKVDGFDGTAPKSWSEVSKALEDLKPSLQSPVSTPKSQTPMSTPAVNDSMTPKTPVVKKNQLSFRTIEELDKAKKDAGAKITPAAAPPPPSRTVSLPAALPEALRPVSQNSFILRDRQEREKRNSMTEDPTRLWRRDPLHGFSNICPPGGVQAVVLYTTTVRAVRRTFEDCEAARQTLEGHLLGEVDIDERDISLHGEYLKELRELVGEDQVSVPRLFVLGRYIGGVRDVEELNESGRLGAIMRLARRTKLGGGATEASPAPTGRRGCTGCGGARFLPCLVCHGSCKVLAEDEKEVLRCGECNENGLVKCPRCN